MPRAITLLIVLIILGVVLAGSYLTLRIIEQRKDLAPSNGNENVNAATPLKEEREPCDASWAPGVCLRVLTPGYYFDQIRKECTFYEGSGCSDPPYATPEECEIACASDALSSTRANVSM